MKQYKYKNYASKGPIRHGADTSMPAADTSCTDNHSYECEWINTKCTQSEQRARANHAGSSRWSSLYVVSHTADCTLTERAMHGGQVCGARLNRTRTILHPPPYFGSDVLQTIGASPQLQKRRVSGALFKQRTIQGLFMSTIGQQTMGGGRWREGGSPQS